jgi:sugar phosphate isomerase/epimerase
MSWALSAFADEAADTADLQIQALKRAGLKFIDLRGIEGHNISVLPLDIAEQVQKKLAAAGISVGMFGSPIGKIDIADDIAIDLGKLEHLGKLSSIFGCKAVRIFSYYNKTKLDAAVWQERSLSNLSKLRDLAGKLGLVLYHENEHAIFGDSVEHVALLASRLRQPNGSFRLIFDFDNYNQCGEDVWQAWLKLKPTTDAFHLKDSDASKQHVPVGQGAGQVSKILADALASGWSGPLSLEPHLQHSKAVQATNVGGQENKALKEMSRTDVFQIAAEAALKLLGQIKAPLV